jgi:membrane protein YdbS with pleckstrin-like domain
MTHAIHLSQEPSWHALEPSAKNLMTVCGALPFLIPVIPISILSLVLMPLWWGLAVAITATCLLLWLGLYISYQHWWHVRWRLDDAGFRLRKGHYWQKEIFIPHSRVQHLDIHNGPMERQRNLATLVIHTAGSRSHALKQGGFSLENATMLRNALIPEVVYDDSAL